MLRIFTALVLAPSLWVLIKVASPRTFLAFALAVVVLASWECYRLFEVRGARPFTWVGLAAAVAVVWSFVGAAPRFEARLPLVVAAGATLLLAMLRRADAGAMLDATLHTLFPLVFVGLGLAYLVGLRTIPGEDGKDLLLLLFLCVILADTAAYYVGRSLGRRRMAPLLSPRKSWEGAVAGLLGSVLAAGVAHAWFYRRLPLGHALALGLLLGVGSIAGDLAESMLKRAAGVKDASGLLPGHGGVLDRTDSLLFTSPLLYYYYLLFLRGAA